jgi:1-acyl-sn-glycerol-3-phosphate acyltransferase
MRIAVPRVGFPFTAPTQPGGVEVLPDEPAYGVHYDTGYARRQPARMARVIFVEGPLRVAVQGLAAPTRAGLDRLTDLRGPAIFAGNHHSHLDAPILLTSIPEPWRHRLVIGAAADYFFGNWLTSAASALALGAVPFERTRVNRRSADQLAELIADRWSVVIFPEGGRSPDGWGQGHRGIAAYLASRCDVPVVPVHIRGTDRIYAKGDRRPRPGVTTVTFGHPILPVEGENTTRLAARIEAAVATLADEAATDWWGARQRAAAGTTPPLTGPSTTSWRRAWALGDRRGRRRSSATRWPSI